MNFTDFKIQFQDRPYILGRDVARGGQDLQAIRNQLSRWQKKGLIIALRKGFYVLNHNDRKLEINQNFMANVLYEPSYVSLESALNFYGLIPEKVMDVTSVTTRKTVRFHNKCGNFIYQHIKPEAFRGFKRMGEGQTLFFMAEPEKAVVDFLYLNLSQFAADTRELLEHSYRFQNIEELNKKRMIELGKLFNSKKLMHTINKFGEWIDEAHHD